MARAGTGRREAAGGVGDVTRLGYPIVRSCRLRPLVTALPPQLGWQHSGSAYGRRWRDRSGPSVSRAAMSPWCPQRVALLENPSITHPPV